MVPYGTGGNSQYGEIEYMSHAQNTKHPSADPVTVLTPSLTRNTSQTGLTPSSWCHKGRDNGVNSVANSSNGHKFVKKQAKNKHFYCKKRAKNGRKEY